MRKLRHRRSERETVTAMSRAVCVCGCSCSDAVCSCQPIPTHAILGLQSSSKKTKADISQTGGNYSSGKVDL